VSFWPTYGLPIMEFASCPSDSGSRLLASVQIWPIFGPGGRSVGPGPEMDYVNYWSGFPWTEIRCSGRTSRKFFSAMVFLLSFSLNA